MIFYYYDFEKHDLYYFHQSCILSSPQSNLIRWVVDTSNLMTSDA